MMQATQVKQAAKTELLNTSFNTTLVQAIEDKAVKLVESKSGELTKAQSFNRLLEAYGDCV